MRVYLLRHGRTAYNDEQRYQGLRDIPLSQMGEEELRPVEEAPETVYVSPLSRARRTAELLFPHARQVPVEGFREMDFGALQRGGKLRCLSPHHPLAAEGSARQHQKQDRSHRGLRQQGRGEARRQGGQGRRSPECQRRPDPPSAAAAEELPADAYRDDVAANLAVAERWVTEHSDTEFDFFLPPYSILFWDKVIREGRTEAVFAAIRQAGQTLLQYDNVKFYGYLMDPEIVTNLDNYCDYIHHSGGVCREILAMLQREEGRLTEENLAETLANWREFVVHYDYDQFWDERFWIQWNAEHAAAP